MSTRGHLPGRGWEMGGHPQIEQNEHKILGKWPPFPIPLLLLSASASARMSRMTHGKLVGLLHGRLFTATRLFITNNKLHLKFTHVYAVGLQCAAKKYW